MKLFFAALIVFVSTVASADQSCLSQATNQDLLRELEIRLQGSPLPQTPLSTLAFTCTTSLYGSPVLSITITNLASGTDRTTSMGVTSADICVQLRDILGRSKGSISEPVVVAVPSTSLYGSPLVTRILIKPTGDVQRLSDLPVTSSDAALATARDIDSHR